MKGHLDENQLLELSTGLLTEEALPGLEAHLDACSDCLRAVARVMRSQMDIASKARDLPTFPLANPDHFLLAEEFARGGMGRIRLARDLRLGRVVALKEMLVDSPPARARFEREARITAQLQHPSIVQVHEAGIWPSGERFYAMTWLEGRSLDAVVAEARTLEARLALLPNVLAVADAMAFAHARGVIHRDLKPKNVLVGVFGETIVIDWGLAKDLSNETPEDSFAQGGGQGGSGSGETTTAGEIIGTPAYMPLEQALGRTLDARADVYAIGAMLHQVLSGKPPYAEAASNQTLEAVRAGPPVSLAVLEPDAPPELLTLVNRAMAREPEDRYPSARELAEDLRRYQTGRLVGAHQYSFSQLARRWLGRHRAPVTVGALALGLLTAISVVSVRQIIRAEQLAEERREKAEDLVGFMVGDLHSKLAPIGRLDALEPVARKAVAYYEVQQTGSLSESEQLKHAKARRNLGDVLSSLGDSTGAVEAYRMALSIDELLVAKDPTNLTHLGEVSLSHDALAVALASRGDLEEALVEFKAALAVDELRLAREPARPERKRAVAVGLGQVGQVLAEQGHYPESQTKWLAALALFEDLARQDPLNPGRRMDLAVAQLSAGRALSLRGDAAGAGVQFRSALALCAGVAQAEPKNAEWQSLLASAHTELGDALLQLNDIPAALVEFRAAMAIDERLSEKDPTNALRLRDVSVDHTRIAGVLQRQRDVQGALAEFRASLAIAQSLEAKDPNDQAALVDLRSGHIGVGEQLFVQEDYQGALAAFRTSLAIGQRMLAKDPTSGALQVGVFNDHGRIGKVLAYLGDLRGALDENELMRAGHAELVAKNPEVFDWQVGLAFSHDQQGIVFSLQRNFPSAMSQFRARLAIDQALLLKFPDRVDVKERLAEAHSRVADVLLAQGDAQEALAAYRLSMASSETLVDNLSSVELQALVDRQEHLGDALLASKEPVQAKVEYTAALKRALSLHAVALEDKSLGRQVGRIEAKVKKISASRVK